jgi:hypothetical protein
MENIENNRFFKLVSKERQLTQRMLEYGWTGISFSALGMATMVVTGLEQSIGTSPELVTITEDLSFVGLFVGIGSFAMSGLNATRKVALSDSLQTEQAKNFSAMMTSEQGRDLLENTDFIIQHELPDDFTEGWE